MRYVMLLYIILLLLIPRTAFAHPLIVRTEPEAYAQLTTAPSVVRIAFNETIEEQFALLHLFNTQGNRVDDGSGGRDTGDPSALVLHVASLPPGIYTAVWQAVGSDGHLVRGNVIFTVLGTQTTATLPTSVVSAAPTAVLIAPTPVAPVTKSVPSRTPLWTTFFHSATLVALSLATGGWLAWLLVVVPAMTAAGWHTRPRLLADEIFPRWKRWQLIALVIALVSGTALALVQMVSLAGRIDGETAQQLLVGTRIGQMIAARIVLTIISIIFLIGMNDQRQLFVWAGAVLGGLTLATFTASSHAASQPSPLVPMLNHWAHMIVAALWIGGLFTLSTVLGTLRTYRSDEAQPKSMVLLIARFSQLALVSVLVLAGSGTAAALLHIHTPTELLTSEYGIFLLVKLGLLAALIMFGAYNLLVIRPRLAQWITMDKALIAVQGHLSFTVRSEMVLGGLAIVIAGVLANTAPPPPPSAAAPHIVPIEPTVRVVAQPSPQPQATTLRSSEPFVTTAQVEDVLMTLTMSPYHIGANRLDMALTTVGGAPLVAQKVLVRAEMLDMDIGTMTAEATSTGDGRYTTPEMWLSIKGRWQIHIEVRRAVGDDVTGTFALQVSQ